MTPDTTLKDAIRTSLKVLHRMLETATADIRDAVAHISLGQQNMAIGTVIPVEHLLERSLILHRAILTLHRTTL